MLDPTTLSPSVALFTGRTVIHTKDGDLLGTNAGAIDANPFGDGHFADLITFTGGTGNLAGAFGHIVAFGTFSLVTGIGTSDYIRRGMHPIGMVGQNSRSGKTGQE